MQPKPRMNRGLTGFVMAFLVAGTSTAQAQVSQQDLAEIRQRVEEGLAQAIQNAPEQTTQCAGFIIRYKAVPTDPTDIIRQYGGLPQGVNIQSVARQFQSDITRILNSHMGDIGQAEVTGPVSMGRDLALGKYFLGLEMRGLAPVDVLLREYIEPTEQDRRRDPQVQPHAGRTVVTLRFARSAQRDQVAPTLALELQEIPKKEGQFTLRVDFYMTQALTQPFKAAAAESHDDHPGQSQGGHDDNEEDEPEPEHQGRRQGQNQVSGEVHIGAELVEVRIPISDIRQPLTWNAVSTPPDAQEYAWSATIQGDGHTYELGVFLFKHRGVQESRGGFAELLADAQSSIALQDQENRSATVLDWVKTRARVEEGFLVVQAKDTALIEELRMAHPAAATIKFGGYRQEARSWEVQVSY